MLSLRIQWPRLAIGLVFCLVIALVQAKVASSAEKGSSSPGLLSLEELDDKLQVLWHRQLRSAVYPPMANPCTPPQECSIVQILKSQKLAGLSDTPSLITRLFSALFFGPTPAWNALLATAYISGPPNILLALCPPNIDPASLSIMVAFAVGGLMGDTLFHLLPEIFLGEDDPQKVRLVLVEPNRNLLLGVAILVGFMTFVAMDKGLRIATGGGGGHDHGHSHSQAHSKDEASTTTGVEVNGANGAVKLRKKANGSDAVAKAVDEIVPDKEINSSVKLAGLLNLVADFTHNITDGLALSASFYASPTVGATTTMAVFFHEIPHEVGDFALLIQSGFTKKAAMGAQFVTAIGAFVGTLIGIWVQELDGGADSSAAPLAMDAGIWGTSLTAGDLLLPFTAGTFLYVGTVAVIPDLLETGKNKGEELVKTLNQFAAIALGAGVMLWISWH